MLIKIRYMDNRFDMVRPEILDLLLADGKVQEFERQDGWVLAGIDRVRVKAAGEYSGYDRRMKRDV